MGMLPVNEPPKSLDPKDDPLNWKETKTESGDVYYYNTVTNDVNWEKPAGYIPVSVLWCTQNPIAHDNRLPY